MKRHLIIHSHFYQPPRENPLFDDVDAEPSAAPFHDWNQRIDRECYRAVVAARINADHGRIIRLVNTLEAMSFNVGATLFEWMERHAADTYQRILAADRISLKRLGHGNAMAQPYHHVILPLATRRDKLTEVRWGKADFRRRYGRDPDGMWLPETAVDDETLDVLAQEGMQFAVLAPYQVSPVPPDGRPGRYTTTHGRQIALFPYHGDMSHGIGFGGLVRDTNAWLQAIHGFAPSPRAEGDAAAKPDDPLLVSAATDGETYGHHHKFAEMALAYVLEQSRARGTVVTNYASFLSQYPAVHDVDLVEPSAWSCAHGVERWRSNCGCRMDTRANPSQEWRTPLRDGLNTLADGLHAVFETEGRALFGDVWTARDAYGALVSESDITRREQGLNKVLRSGVSSDQRSRAVELMEMERDALRMFTSCAWFFDDIGGLEPRQVLRYASRAITLSGAEATLVPALRATLGTALSNQPDVVSGARVFDQVAEGLRAPVRVAASVAALRAFGLDVEHHLPPGFDATADGDLVRVVARQTGRLESFRVVEARRSAADIAFHVNGTEVTLADLPERPRLAVRGALRRVLLPKCLTPHELEHLATGEVTFRGMVAVALTRAVAGLAVGVTDERLDVANATLDLFTQLELSMPFDAQTAFWDVWHGAPAADRTRIIPLATRLGFQGLTV